MQRNRNIPNYCKPWPGNSPGLNPIENAWKICNSPVKKRKPHLAKGIGKFLNRSGVISLRRLLRICRQYASQVMDAQGWKYEALI